MPEGPALQGVRLAANKLIKHVVMHSDTCSLTRVTQLHIAVCVSHITLYVTVSIGLYTCISNRIRMHMYICKHYH